MIVTFGRSALYKIKQTGVTGNNKLFMYLNFLISFHLQVVFSPGFQTVSVRPDRVSAAS